MIQSARTAGTTNFGRDLHTNIYFFVAGFLNMPKDRSLLSLRTDGVPSANERGST